jgi:hypothetical protein
MRAAYGVTPAAVYELVHVCQACAVRQREFEQLLVNGIKSAMGLIPFCTK